MRVLVKVLIGIFLIFCLAFLYNKYKVYRSSSSLLPSLQNTSGNKSLDIPQISIVAENLDTPWAIAFLPDRSMLFTERKGDVRFVDASGKLGDHPFFTVPGVKEIGEGGLLGITIHPDFASNHFVYLYYTYSANGDNTLNRVVRETYRDNRFTDQKIIIDAIPGASNHNGGRIKFGPDKLLYVGTGDAENPSQAQNTGTLGGKILRVSDDGQIPSDNPFGNLVFSYGHRNVQGLTWDTNKNLWATEHGRSGALSGLDEINLIQKGRNYGWPIIQGNETKNGMESPRMNSGSTTWAPSGDAAIGDMLYFSGLRGQSLYSVSMNAGQSEIQEHLNGQFGRLREVIVGPDNMLYVTTSNKDGRGIPKDTDDKILRINPAKL